MRFPFSLLRLSVMPRLLRCRFWKSLPEIVGWEEATFDPEDEDVTGQCRPPGIREDSDAASCRDEVERALDLVDVVVDAVPEVQQRARVVDPASQPNRIREEALVAKGRYEEASIRVLKGLQPVRERPGMYTRTIDPTHIVAEVIDNAADDLDDLNPF